MAREPEQRVLGGLPVEEEGVLAAQALSGAGPGGDVVEVSPPFDPSGNTALVAVTMMWEMLCLLAEIVKQNKR